MCFLAGQLFQTAKRPITTQCAYHVLHVVIMIGTAA